MTHKELKLNLKDLKDKDYDLARELIKLRIKYGLTREQFKKVQRDYFY